MTGGGLDVRIRLSEDVGVSAFYSKQDIAGAVRYNRCVRIQVGFSSACSQRQIAGFGADHNATIVTVLIAGDHIALSLLDIGAGRGIRRNGLYGDRLSVADLQRVILEDVHAVAALHMDAQHIDCGFKTIHGSAQAVAVQQAYSLTSHDAQAVRFHFVIAIRRIKHRTSCFD